MVTSKSIAPVVLVCLASWMQCFAADAPISGDKTSVTEALPKHGKVTVTIFTRKVPADYIYAGRYAWGGDEAQPPKTIIKAIEVKRDGVLFVPLSAYSDLGNPSRVSLIPSADASFTVTIFGGDAAGSYRATLDFENGEIARRNVVSGEFPKEVWEETKYSFNHLDN